MAKIVATYDTVEKTLDITMDGAAVPNVTEARFGVSYDDDDEYMVSLTTREVDEANDLRRYTHLVAAQSKSGQQLLAKGAALSPKLPGFVVNPDSGLAAEIAALFAARPRTRG